MSTWFRLAVATTAVWAQLSAVALAQTDPAAPGTADTPPGLAHLWSRIPNGDDLAKVYPRQAQKRGLEGMVRMTCKVHANGRLWACVATADPPGAGFEEAALKLASKFRANMANRPPMAAGGDETIHVPIAFRMITD